LRRSGLRADARSIFRPDFELLGEGELKLRPSGFDQGASRGESTVLGGRSTTASGASGSAAPARSEFDQRCVSASPQVTMTQLFS